MVTSFNTHKRGALVVPQNCWPAKPDNTDCLKPVSFAGVLNCTDVIPASETCAFNVFCTGAVGVGVGGAGTGRPPPPPPPPDGVGAGVVGAGVVGAGVVGVGVGTGVGTGALLASAAVIASFISLSGYPPHPLSCKVPSFLITHQSLGQYLVFPGNVCAPMFVIAFPREVTHAWSPPTFTHLMSPTMVQPYGALLTP